MEHFNTAEDTSMMAQVASRLNALDPDREAVVEHTGGGIFCIYVSGREPGTFMYWGTTDGFWGADTNELDGTYLESVITELPSTSTDIDTIASTILSTIRETPVHVLGSNAQ